MGSSSFSYHEHMEAITLAEKYRNVYVDTAIVLIQDILLEAVKRCGPEKIIFGTDAPAWHPGPDVFRIRLLHLKKKDEDKILGGNIIKLLA